MSETHDERMARLDVNDPDGLTRMTGTEIAVSPWLSIDQARVNAFADATGDHQWIHVDPERARRESPFGGPVAHGFLTLSLLPAFLQQSIRIDGSRMGMNYGLNRVRFISPVPVDARLRARFVLDTVTPIEHGVQLGWTITIERDGGARPACLAELLTRSYH